MRYHSFPIYRQLDVVDCGPTCLQMICKYYGRKISLPDLRRRCSISKTGVSLLGISEAAEDIGFQTTGVRVTLPQLVAEVSLPCIVHWKQRHFVVVYDVRRRRQGRMTICVADPAVGRCMYSPEEFQVCWASEGELGDFWGIALILEPTPLFYQYRDSCIEIGQSSLSFFLSYIRPHHKKLFLVGLSLLVASMLQLISPFLAQSLIDVGIAQRDQNYITLILISQLVIFLSRLSLEYIRSWLLLHINYQINLGMVSDYLERLMSLSMRFFDSKHVGDILQRITDNNRIHKFLTGSSINTLFSLVSFLVFSVVLGTYNWAILLIFLLGNSLYVGWVLLFMRYRKALDNKRFAQASAEQANLYQMVTGMQEIKLNNCERERRKEWERIQVKLYHIGVKSLTIGQLQQVGTLFFSQVTSILISYLAARNVIWGEMTLGMMLSLSYILGQLSAPVEQFIGFAQDYQDASVSIDRLNEINQGGELEEDGILEKLPEERSLSLDSVNFSYEEVNRDYVLKNISLCIPEKKVTAIVGASGSGKTTLLKLLLGFYPVIKGQIRVGNIPITRFRRSYWYSLCGVVMQDGFIFSDSIAKNIAMTEDLDWNRVLQSVHLANLDDYISSLPQGLQTKIGMEGSGLSQGQRQRILIARAIYKNPQYIFLDEATNALDANNEWIIMEHLRSFYEGRTVVVVAHRLSTVRDAEQIVVLDAGRIVEIGTHDSLIAHRGKYFELIKNQLELGM